MARRKRPEIARIAALVGEPEAEDYAAIHAACAKLTEELGDRFYGGGGIALVDPPEVRELGGHFRPGFVVLADELAGDRVCWDVRRGPPRAGERPAVFYVDHEIGTAEPFARGVGGALVHVLAIALVGEPRSAMAGAASRWLAHLGPLLAEAEREVLERLVREATKGGARPVFANVAASRRFVRSILPDVAPTLGMLPPTHLPLLDPDSREELDRAIAGYEEAAAVYREMVHDEGRSGYGWWLAAALRGLSDVLLRRRRWSDASAAAEEAIAHYEPILAAGDGRVATMLAFAHRVVATVHARSKQWAPAYEHASRALDLQESALQDYAAAVVGLGALAESWEIDLAGGDADRARGLLSVAARSTEAFVGKTPPHAFAEQGERVARIAAARSPRRRR